MTDDKKFTTLKEWYLNEDLQLEDLTTKQFYSLLHTLDFKLLSEKLKNDVKIYYLKDMQGGNNNHIEQDIFYEEYEHNNKQKEITFDIKHQVFDRLEAYLEDYFVVNNAFDDD